MNTNLYKILMGLDQEEEISQNKEGGLSAMFTFIAVPIVFHAFTTVVPFLYKFIRNEITYRSYYRGIEDEIFFAEVFANRQRWVEAIRYVPRYQVKIADKLVSDPEIFKANISTYADFRRTAQAVPNFKLKGALYIVTNPELFKLYINRPLNIVDFYKLYPDLQQELINQVIGLSDSDFDDIFKESGAISLVVNGTGSTQLRDFFRKRAAVSLQLTSPINEINAYRLLAR